MSPFISWHKKYINWWGKKLNISDYGMLWGAFIKGAIIGLLIYHFFIKYYFLYLSASSDPPVAVPLL